MNVSFSLTCHQDDVRGNVIKFFTLNKVISIIIILISNNIWFFTFTMFYIVMLCNNTKVAVDTVDSQADAGCILCILSHMRSYIGYKANTRP